jgi:hypothetical protein
MKDIASNLIKKRPGKREARHGAMPVIDDPKR